MAPPHWEGDPVSRCVQSAMRIIVTLHASEPIGRSTKSYVDDDGCHISDSVLKHAVSIEPHKNYARKQCVPIERLEGFLSLSSAF